LPSPPSDDKIVLPSPCGLLKLLRNRVQSLGTIEFHYLLKAWDLPCTRALFEVRARAVTQEEMLKMKDDPDELLKTKGKFRTKNIEADGCLKIKELR